MFWCNFLFLLGFPLAIFLVLLDVIYIGRCISTVLAFNFVAFMNPIDMLGQIFFSSRPVVTLITFKRSQLFVHRCDVLVESLCSLGHNAAVRTRLCVHFLLLGHGRRAMVFAVMLVEHITVPRDEVTMIAPGIVCEPPVL
jgi:hypothetical protein